MIPAPIIGTGDLHLIERQREILVMARMIGWLRYYGQEACQFGEMFVGDVHKLFLEPRHHDQR